MDIQGACEAKFHAVRQEFERNFSERGEVGASVCVIVRGQHVVNLWGGTARVDTGTPWTENTLGLVFSCTKGATALCAHILASRGLLDLDAPVAKYWPAFAQAGKSTITVKMLLNHQAGLPALRKPLPEGAFYNWELVVAALEQEEPFWQPGTRNGYHGLTFGWLVGEVVRRVSGKSLGTFFHDEVAKPLGLDFWIGLPEQLEPRVAPMIPGEPDPESPFFVAMANPTSLQTLLFLNTGGYMTRPDYDSRAAHAAEIWRSGRYHQRPWTGQYVCPAGLWRERFGQPRHSCSDGGSFLGNWPRCFTPRPHTVLARVHEVHGQPQATARPTR
jgi:CubicO group peptidase (beta-lactamase class C family)